MSFPFSSYATIAIRLQTAQNNGPNLCNIGPYFGRFLIS